MILLLLLAAPAPYELVQEWTGEMSCRVETHFRGSQGVQVVKEGETQMVIEIDHQATVSFELTTSPNSSPDLLVWEGPAILVKAVVKDKASTSPAGKLVSDSTVDGTPTPFDGATATLTIDPTTSTYLLEVPSASLETATVRSVVSQTGMKALPPERGSASIDFPKVENQKAVGAELTGSVTEKQQVIPPEGLPMAADIRCDWSIKPKPPKDAELVLSAQDPSSFDTWLPFPINDPKIPAGTRQTFTAELVPTKGAKTIPSGRIDLELTGVSRNAGTAVNYPLNPKPANDLRFADQQYQPSDVVIDDELHAHSKDPKAQKVSVVVEATDTGAFGQLEARCASLGLTGVERRSNQKSISIPRDDDHNFIADAFERQRGLFGRLALPTEDDDQPKQRRLGDGYTYYEEYRGFLTKAGFVRTDPVKKDLFVYDPDSLVHDHYEPYNPSGTNLHYVDPTMMVFSGEARTATNRWVNFNSGPDRFYAKQYALYVVRWTTLNETVRGEDKVFDVLAPGEASSSVADKKRLSDIVGSEMDKLNGIDEVKGTNGFSEPLKDAYVVKIAAVVVDRLFSKEPNQELAQKLWRSEMDWTVIHEIGHAIGMPHHHFLYLGVPSCAMRYRTPQEKRHSKALLPMVRYCRKAETWKENIHWDLENGDKEVEWKDSPSDGCWEKIDIKSDP